MAQFIRITDQLKLWDLYINVDQIIGITPHAHLGWCCVHLAHPLEVSTDPPQSLSIIVADFEQIRSLLIENTPAS